MDTPKYDTTFLFLWKNVFDTDRDVQMTRDYQSNLMYIHTPGREVDGGKTRNVWREENLAGGSRWKLESVEFDPSTVTP